MGFRKNATINIMKQRNAFTVIFLFFTYLSMHAQEIYHGKVVDDNRQAVASANVVLLNDKDSTFIVGVTTGEDGSYKITSKEKGLLKISCIGYETKIIQAKPNEYQTISLPFKATGLDEVVVKASPVHIKNLDDGIIYNLAKDKYAQKDNLLNALNRIPLLMVSSNGTINVAGKNSYVVYLNGKPYHIANADPGQVLRSIPSSDIKQVEVITRPAQRFGESAPVINIITRGNSLEGYHVNINGMGATTPKATGAASFLGIKNNVQFYAGYTYDLWGQRDVRWRHEYKFGNEKSTFSSSDKNHRNRHTHLGRALFQWDVDTLRQVYADFHIDGIELNERTFYDQGNLNDNEVSGYKSVSDTWDASLETNIIYSSRFKNSKARKWRVGYRFTLNPDNRDYLIEQLTANSTTRSKTKGRLYTHNLQVFRRVNFTKQLFSYFTLNTHIRKGSSDSDYLNGTTVNHDDEFRYTQILGSFDWRTIWYMTKSNDLWLDFTNKFEYADDKSTDMDSHRQSFSYIPSVKLTWQPNWDNEFSLAFNSRISRPSLQMLNPFIGGKTNNDVTQGSPELRNARSYALSLGYSYLGKKLTIFPTVTGSFTRNALMGVFDTDKTNSLLIETYSNISKVKTLSFELFLAYRPWQWLTLRNVSSCGIQNIADDNKALDQSDRFYRSASTVTFNLPQNWKFETRFNCYKVTPKAWVTYESGTMYGFSLSKTLMKGNMYVSVFADSPFAKHGEMDSHTLLSAPNVSYDKLWKVQVRCVGIEVSINLNRGKKAGLKRNTSLQDTDIKTGI